MSMNCWNAIGRLCADPEIRTTQAGTNVVSFRLAVDRDGKDSGTDFIPCVAWKETADFCKRNFKKGMRVGVQGRIESRSWTDKDGKNRTTYECHVFSIYFADGRIDAAPAAPALPATPASDFNPEDVPDSELPF